MKYKILLFFLLSTPLLSNQFIITYTITSRDNIIINEKFDVSKAMTVASVEETHGRCEIFLEEDDEGKVKEVLRDKKDEILSCLFDFGVKLRSDGITSGLISSSTAKLSIPPTRVFITFKDDFAIIELITKHF